MPSIDLTSLYALGLQACAVIALIYAVILVGARTFAAADPAPRPESARKTHAYTTAGPR